MKCTLKLIVLGAVVLAIGLAPVIGGIVGSAHDTAFAAWGANTNDEICAPCHTPHNAKAGVTAAPLWNHDPTVAVYTLYDSPTFAGIATIAQPSGVSKLCLGCHDGTVAPDKYGTNPGAETIAATANFGIDLSNDHPIAFTYNDALAGAAGEELFPPTTTASGIPGGADIDDDMLFGAGNDQMECASCHDVHNNDGNTYLLRIDNASSGLCLTCHDK